jgi:hypothetical protein
MPETLPILEAIRCCPEGYQGENASDDENTDHKKKHGGVFEGGKKPGKSRSPRPAPTNTY